MVQIEGLFSAPRMWVTPRPGGFSPLHWCGADRETCAFQRVSASLSLEMAAEVFKRLGL